MMIMAWRMGNKCGGGQCVKKMHYGKRTTATGKVFYCNLNILHLFEI